MFSTTSVSSDSITFSVWARSYSRRWKGDGARENYQKYLIFLGTRDFCFFLMWLSLSPVPSLPRTVEVLSLEVHERSLNFDIDNNQNSPALALWWFGEDSLCYRSGGYLRHVIKYGITSLCLTPKHPVSWKLNGHGIEAVIAESSLTHSRLAISYENDRTCGETAQKRRRNGTICAEYRIKPEIRRLLGTPGDEPSSHAIN